MHIKDFQKEIWNYYSKNRRSFPWRDTFDSYKIVVSEVMLQQTQAGRVVPKYEAFIKEFPNFQALARAPVRKVLLRWQGLGYNRRALNLKKLAGEIVEKHQGRLPESVEKLDMLPGIGEATAGSIYVFVFNKPSAFIETNIRRVFIHFFLPRSKNVSDEKILTLVEKSMDRNNPREWFYALMDYGAMFPREVINPNRRSKHYTKQSKFEGSNRQIRGAILKFVTKYGTISKRDFKKLPFDRMKLISNIESLREEGFFS